MLFIFFGRECVLLSSGVVVTRLGIRSPLCIWYYVVFALSYQSCVLFQFVLVGVCVCMHALATAPSYLLTLFCLVGLVLRPLSWC